SPTRPQVRTKFLPRSRVDFPPSPNFPAIDPTPLGPALGTCRAHSRFFERNVSADLPNVDRRHRRCIPSWPYPSTYTRRNNNKAPREGRQFAQMPCAEKMLQVE